MPYFVWPFRDMDARLYRLVTSYPKEFVCKSVCKEGVAPSDEPFYGFSRIKSARREFFMQTRGEGKIGRAVMTIAMLAAEAVIVLAIVMVVGLTVRRFFFCGSVGHREVSPQSSMRPFLLESYPS